MVKVSILSDEIDENYRTIMGFYNYNSTVLNEGGNGKLIYMRSLEYSTKKINTHTLCFSTEQIINLKKALEEI